MSTYKYIQDSILTYRHTFYIHVCACVRARICVRTCVYVCVYVYVYVDGLMLHVETNS